MPIEITKTKTETTTVVTEICLTCDKCQRSYILDSSRCLHFKEEHNGQEFFCVSCQYEIENEKRKKFYDEKLIGAVITDYELQEDKLAGLEVKHENGDTEWIDLHPY
jgi:hypothetical protein